MDQLKLTILQGPNKGESRVVKPESQIRIGRVVRGNNLTIKDSGISSKHLLIGFESGKWVLRDLDSSNGTILNSTTISPNAPFDILNGDIIKIGESTSLLVEFLGIIQTREDRVAGNGSKNVGVIESPEKGLRNVGVVEEGRKTRGRGKNVKFVESREVGKQSRNVEVIESRGDGFDEGGKKTRGRGKGLRNVGVIESRDEGFDEEERGIGVVVEGRKTRGRGRPSRKVGVIESQGVGDLVIEKKVVVSPRRTRSRKNEGNLVSGLEEVGIGGRVTRARVRKEAKEDVIEEEVEVGGRGRTKRGRPTRKGKEVEVSSNDLDSVVVKGEVEVGERLGLGDGVVGDVGKDKENEKEFDVGNEVNDVVFDVRVQNREAACDNVSGKEGKDSGLRARDNTQSERKSFDPEKMTFGEWLDCLEVSLPKQIIDATEDMIKDMKHKAELVCELISTKNENEVPVS